MNTDIQIDAVIAGEARLDPAQSLQLYREASIHDLSRWASAVCRRLHGDRIRTYVIDRNINYTNICSVRCTFCAFRRDADEADAFVLGREQLHQKVRELMAIGGTQILLQGGMHPGLPLSFYENMLADLKAAFPTLHIHGFSPPELVELVAACELDGFPTPGENHSDKLEPEVWRAKLSAILSRLKAAGLDSVPGGGGEVLVESVRRRIARGKATTSQWLDVMAEAQKLGMYTSATMMFGHIEGLADHILHLDRLRNRQDEAIAEGRPGKYVSFFCWPFQRGRTPLGRLPDWQIESGRTFPGDLLAEQIFRGEVDEHDDDACRTAAPKAGKVLRTATGLDYLRLLAIARLYLDNIPAVGASWVTMGPKIGQLSLSFGANDMGSVMMEENVVSAAGTSYCLTEPFLCHLIRQAGYVPAQRDNRYHYLKIHNGDDSPDRQIKDWSTQRVNRLHHQVEATSPA